MSVTSLDPWVAKVRMGILLLGLAWPAVVFIMGLADADKFTWMAIGASFIATIFAVPVLALAFVFPTYKSRIIAVPLLLALVFWWLESGSSTYNGLSLPPQMGLWIVSLTALTMLIPEFSSVKAFYRSVFHLK